MGNYSKREGSTLTIAEAVETLSNIAEMDIDRELLPDADEFSPKIPFKSTAVRSMQWLQEHDPDATIGLVKETFRVILTYLHNYYKKKYRFTANQQATEGVKAIMVLVGEAAKKLDRYAVFVQNHMKSVTELKEYKHLQEFYLSRIARKIDEGVLSRWILALAQRAISLQQRVPEKTMGARILHSQHVFVDLESVKKDTEYELFFIRKEDGSRFFSPRLIRNIKLVCDFGERLQEFKRDDPLESIRLWRDRSLRAAAANILSHVSLYVDRFFHEAVKSKEWELGTCLRKALMALMLCSNQHNVMHDLSIKSSSAYFLDFQNFLREALHSREYQKLSAYPEERVNPIAKCLFALTHALCEALILHTQCFEELRTSVISLVQEANQEKSSEHTKTWVANQELWSHLAADYAALSALMKRHQSGPLVKVIDNLEEGIHQSFDPLIQENIPSELFSLKVDNKRVSVIHMPSPTHQEYIQKVNVAEEFKGFLYSLASNSAKSKFLVINLQDRSSWREHARSSALEGLQKHSDFSKQLTVVTLAKDTEFYQQLAPYYQDNHANVFMQQLRDQVLDENCGFFFPKVIKAIFTKEYIEGVINGVHAIFFGGKNVLQRERRLEFIEIFYLFLELKLIEAVNPDAMSFMCKDGVDVGSTSSALMFVFLKFMNEEHLSKKDMEQLNVILYSPSILVRERLLVPERFHRMQSAIKQIEHVRSDYGWKEFVKVVQGKFDRFFKNEIRQICVKS